MSAPTWSSSSVGATDAGGAWSYVVLGDLIDTLFILQIIQDGGTSGAVAITSITAGRVADLAGTADQLTFIGVFNVGGGGVVPPARQHLWIGRSTSALSATVSGSNSTSEDLYIMSHHFANVSSGATLATVIENVTPGAVANSDGTTSTTVLDTSVITLDVDRLALNFVAINDDATFSGFTGESGGTWVTRASYADASGTDGAIYLTTAAMPTALTSISGGAATISPSAGWGTVGFALIGTTVTVARTPHIDRQMPQLLAHAAPYRPRRRMTFLDGLWRPDRRLLV